MREENGGHSFEHYELVTRICTCTRKSTESIIALD